MPDSDTTEEIQECEERCKPLIPYFTVTFYFCEEHKNFNVGFDYDGPALRRLKDDVVAADLSEAALRARAIIGDLFADSSELMDRISQSDNFHDTGEMSPAEFRASIAKEGH